MPSVITNADNGVAVFLPSICGGGSNCSNTYQLTLVANDAVTSQANVVLGQNTSDSFVAGPGTGFSPTLQREDGSYIGADLVGNLFAIGLDGSVVWQQQITTPPLGGGSAPAVYPLYATADGGAIVTSTPPTCPPGDLDDNWLLGIVCLSNGLTPLDPAFGLLGTLYTVDQNGNVTSQTADPGAKYSWKATYATTGDPELNQVPPSFDLATIATNAGAVASGNLTGNGVSLGHHTFGLVFCGSAPADGPCTAITQLNGTFPVTFSYLPGMSSTNWLGAPPLSATNTAWPTTIKYAALAAFINAFTSLPAIVSPNPASDFQLLPNQAQFEHTVYVVGDYWSQANGQTFTAYRSGVYYANEVIGAQDALNSNPQPTDTVAMQKMVQTIGTGIGNTAVHEIAWQLDFNGFGTWNMFCSYPDSTQACEAGDIHVYEFEAGIGSGNDSNFGVGEAIHWQEYNKACKLPAILLDQYDNAPSENWSWTESNGTKHPCTVLPQSLVPPRATPP
jgi:hypothetical protein